MKKYDVIIVGAGPSGLSSAITLLNNGITNICVVEKYTFPRNKPCAGYLKDNTYNLLKNLGIEIEGIGYDKIKNFKLFYRNKKRLEINSSGLWSHKKIDRVELDYELYKKAVSLGIQIIENSKINSHDIDLNQLVINTDIYDYDYLIFADGCIGFSSRYQGNYKKNIAMQAIVECKKDSGIEVHFGITKKGYAWVSSTGDFVNIGITDVFRRKENYLEKLRDFAYLNGYVINNSDIKCAYVPLRVNKKFMINDNIYFVGDALGTCDPLTLAGVSYAIKSGIYAGNSIFNTDVEYFYKNIKKMKYKFDFIYLFMNFFYIRIVLFLGMIIGTKLFGGIVCYLFDKMFVNKNVK